MEDLSKRHIVNMEERREKGISDGKLNVGIQLSGFVRTGLPNACYWALRRYGIYAETPHEGGSYAPKEAHACINHLLISRSMDIMTSSPGSPLTH